MRQAIHGGEVVNGGGSDGHYVDRQDMARLLDVWRQYDAAYRSAAGLVRGANRPAALPDDLHHLAEQMGTALFCGRGADAAIEILLSLSPQYPGDDLRAVLRGMEAATKRNRQIAASADRRPDPPRW